MTQIKSEKAKAMIDKHWNCVIKGVNLSVGYKVSLAAVILAETEAEERHAKELQELRDKAVEAFREFVEYYTEEDGYPEIQQGAEHYIKVFTQKLNE